MFRGINEYIISRLQRDKLLSLIVFLLFLLLMISLFKNISYPLFWADESMTVMGGRRVLEYGYPKVHDGKNVFYDLQHTDTRLGLDEKTDAYIGGANWGQYYIAALGVKLADLSDDLFSKTAIIRALFTSFGVAGLVLLALTGGLFFRSAVSKKTFLIIFALSELLSVPLTLHLREARYYPLTVFLSAVVIFIYTRYRILNNLRYSGYNIAMIIAMCLLFITFSPAYFIFLAAIVLFEIGLPVLLPVKNAEEETAAAGRKPSRRKQFSSVLRNIFPLLFSFAVVFPLLIFFDVFNISKALSAYYAQGYGTDALGLYLRGLSFIWRFFSSSYLIYYAIILKVALMAAFLLWFITKKTTFVSDTPKLLFSVFLSLIFVVYFFVMPKIPTPLFTRYIIALQPILVLIILMDMAVILDFISAHRPEMRIAGRRVLASAFMFFLIAGASKDIEYIKGHFYELTHQYRGPLDYVIPFIRQTFPNTEELIIATNYEETSFMYYLAAKVTVGYVGNNLKEDSLIPPDIIVYRKTWNNFRPVFQSFADQHTYTEIPFPVLDNPTNNVPELLLEPPLQHRFQTQETADERLRTYIFVRTDRP